jgi:cell cycle arrest protein BUB2
MSTRNSPTKQLAPPTSTLINEPPSPRTHRALRRLQSAHTLGQSNTQPSLISQQHKQVLQRTVTPSLPHHTRGRSNSDATNMTPPIPGPASRRPIPVKRPIAADALSLDRLVRDGPPDGDLAGALESTRLKILDQGIKSDTDGMVGDGRLSTL